MQRAEAAKKAARAAAARAQRREQQEAKKRLQAAQTPLQLSGGEAPQGIPPGRVAADKNPSAKKA